MHFRFIFAGNFIVFKKFFVCVLFFIFPLKFCFADSSFLPEIQIYHSLGTRGSSYSTVAGGLAIQLYAPQIGPSRWLHLLGLYSPEQIGSYRGNIARWGFYSPGKGIEVGIYDQTQLHRFFKGANIAFRHLEWEKTRLGSQLGKTSTDILHLGWATGETLMLFWSTDFTMIYTPQNRLFEVQLALGVRFAF